MFVKNKICYPQKKVCDKCGFAKPLEEFPRWKNKYSSGRRTTCKKCLGKIKQGIHIVTAEEAAMLLAQGRAAFNHASLYVQFCVQELLLDAILNNRKTIVEHSDFYRQDAKMCFNEIERLRKAYNSHVAWHYSEESVEMIDDHVNAFVQDVKDKRMQMFYALANYFAKMNHPERKLITCVEFFYALAHVVDFFRKMEINALNKYGVALDASSAFEIDKIVTLCVRLARMCRKKYKYNEPDGCDHLFIAMQNLCNKIKYFYDRQIADTERLYLGFDYEELKQKLHGNNGNNNPQRSN